MKARAWIDARKQIRFRHGWLFKFMPLPASLSSFELIKRDYDNTEALVRIEKQFVCICSAELAELVSDQIGAFD